MSPPAQKQQQQKEKIMDKLKAQQIRKLYAEGISVQDICDQMDVSQSITYSVIRNQSWVDPSYKPPARPRDILESLGQIEISQWRSEGKSWCRISDIIRNETGHQIRGEAISEWYANQDDVRRIARRRRRQQV